MGVVALIVYRTPARSEAERRQRAGFARWFEVFDCWATEWRERLERETVLYDTEVAEFRAANPPPQLQTYMLATAGQPRA